MLTLVGYSINATIIIFDRVRESLATANSKTNITELVNNAVTATLTRTINTNVTTFIMLFTLFIFGASSVRVFALPLMVGVVIGAYSSVCITSAVWYILGGKKKGIADAVKKEKEKAKISSDGAQV